MAIAEIENIFKIGEGGQERYFGQIKTDLLKHIQEIDTIQDFIETMIIKYDKENRLIKSKTYICLVIEFLFRIKEESTPLSSTSHVFIPYDLV